MDKQINTMNNVKVEKKEEKQSTKGKTFFLFKIGDKLMSCWDSNLGQSIPMGSTVNVQYSTNVVGDKTYNNLISIVESRDVEDVANSVEVEETNMHDDNTNTDINTLKHETTKPLQCNNSEDDLFNTCIGSTLNIVGRVYDTHYVKPADVPVRFDEGWVKAFENTFNDIYTKAKEMRKNELGY